MHFYAKPFGWWTRPFVIAILLVAMMVAAVGVQMIDALITLRAVAALLACVITPYCWNVARPS